MCERQSLAFSSLLNFIPRALSKCNCSSIVRGFWLPIYKKVTRQQFYGMPTGSVIVDSELFRESSYSDYKDNVFF